jgi:hypothetical protein
MPASFFSNPAVISAGFNLVGGLLGGETAADAARYSADAQTRAAEKAAEEARFRPVGVTTRFGSSQFDFDPSGKLSGAGYTLSPDLKAYQDRLMALSGTGLTQAELAANQYAPLTGAASGLFSLGQKYLAQTPEEVAQQYMTRQQDLLAPSRERQMSQLQNQLFQQGRGGLSVGATGARPSGAQGLGATTPEMEAYYNAMAQQDAALAAQAQQAGQQQVAFGAGLFGQGANLLNQYQTGQVGALSPFQAYLAATQGIESLGQSPLDIGAQLGGRAATAGAQAGQSLLIGGTNAARTMQPANALNPFARTIGNLAESREFTSGLGRLFSPFGSTPQGAYGQQEQYLSSALSNPQTQQARMLLDQNAGFYASPEGYSSFLV